MPAVHPPVPGTAAQAVRAQQAPASAIKSPVLALSGERDHIHPPATVIQVAERLGGDFHLMPNMSHWLVAEPGWDTAAAVCLDWLTEKGCLKV